MAMDMIAGLPPDPGQGDPYGGAPPDPYGGAAPGQPGPSPSDLAQLLGTGPQAPAQSSPEIVQQMLDLSKSYLDVEKDHDDLLAMQKIGTELQQLLTKDQADADQAMQGKATPRAMRKAFSG